ncbi:hypothetical protein SAMN05192534_10686 [Alteribacillus persepolensis]|uniref:DUF456 domain-containing protein n=1 Tax=Alteribacillus persepolensis TaxID=568899 RepID=A0A1G8CVJ5_9BACI|nr:DUF456 family protein [Alteribacillus persepolensis]SDH49199.1 hypothetical protein SAMN05192534_10686 [Alteribacillus persepolensis]
MDVLLYIVAAVCYILAFIGVIYPIIPGGIFYGAAIIIIGFAEGFSSFGMLFWIVQGLIALFLIAVDYVANYFGIQKSGGTKAAAWGSLIGTVIGPFIIPGVGILIGALLGAVVGQMISGETSIRRLGKIGIGSAAGFLASVVIKGGLLVANLVYVIAIIL